MSRDEIANTMTENELQENIIQMAKACGWLVAHFRPAQNSRGEWRTAVSGDGAGFPDLVLAKEGKVLFWELKSEKGKLNEDQLKWYMALPGALIVKPHNYLDGEVEERLKEE